VIEKVDQELVRHFVNIFSKARKYLLDKGLQDGVIERINPNGDVSRKFDLKVEKILIEGLMREFPKYGIFSEEMGKIRIEGSEHLFVIDPVDGSYNFIRGIGGAGCSIALIEGNNMDIRNIQFAFVGNYISGNLLYAQKNCGAYENYERIRTSDVKKVSDAVAGVNFDYGNPGERERIFPLLKRFKKIRYIGAASIDLCNVAIGAYDAFIDLRDDLTPENFCAAQLIIKEAGGVFVNGNGNDITLFSMSQRFSILAASTVFLKDDVLGGLQN
jgi:myo-inositol-1(or 4)-monophosphatase